MLKENMYPSNFLKFLLLGITTTNQQKTDGNDSQNKMTIYNVNTANNIKIMMQGFDGA